MSGSPGMLLLLLPIAASVVLVTKPATAQEATPGLLEGRAVSFWAGHGTWSNPAGHRFEGSAFAARLGHYRSDAIGFEVGLQTLHDRVGTNLMVDVGGALALAHGSSGVVVRGGGFIGTFTGSPIGVGGYAGLGGAFAVAPAVGIAAEAGGRWVVAGNPLLTLSAGLVLDID